MDCSFRPATEQDAQALADFHVKVWRATYHRLAPPEAIATLDEAFRGRSWAKKLAEANPDELTVLAVQGDRIVGFGSVAMPAAGSEDGRGEIRHLYVDPAMQRRGLGRQLLSRMAAFLSTRQVKGAFLSVVVGNDPAIAVYDALQGRVIGHATDPGPVWRSQNILYAWDDMTTPLRFIRPGMRQGAD